MSQYEQWKAAIDSAGVAGVHRLLKQGLSPHAEAPANVMQSSPFLATPLHMAVRWNEQEIAQILLRAGADPFWKPCIPSSEYLTAFQLAVRFGCVEVVRSILNRWMVDLEQITKAGKTLLELGKASRVPGRSVEEVPEVVQLLLSERTEREVRGAMSETLAASQAARKKSGPTPL